MWVEVRKCGEGIIRQGFTYNVVAKSVLSCIYWRKKMEHLMCTRTLSRLPQLQAEAAISHGEERVMMLCTMCANGDYM